MWDHPRIRGEHPCLLIGEPLGAGSSPHTRGARRRKTRSSLSSRIIPAYAGSTRRPAWSTGGATDHPRIRGEHGTLSFAGLSKTGSSPHTRGAPAARSPPLQRRRIIPAYAGSTIHHERAERLLEDHPRIRGEHDMDILRNRQRRGSSPHTRGARRSASSTPCRSGDHPRIRGEHTTPRPVLAIDSGSSPHTRGALVWFPADEDAVGIIPAYAGSTNPRSWRR